MTKTQDVVFDMDPWASFECDNFTTMIMNSDTTLTMKSRDGDHNSNAHVDLTNLRLEVTNGAKLVWEMNVEFHGTDLRDVNGGAVLVGEGSTVRFLYDLRMTDVGVRSLADKGDYSSYDLSGGCVYTDGYFRVDGTATFIRCEVGGGGESPPGPGGALYVGEQGSVLFNDKLDISEVSIIDDDGNNGGGIYNKGKVNLKGDAVFDNLRAEGGGAIFNAVGAQFRFRSKATALFKDCYAHDYHGGALFNEGYFKFSGEALFVNADAPAIYVSSDGETVLSEDSVFWDHDDYNDNSDPAVFVASGGTIDVPSSVVFYDNDGSECSTVFYEEDQTCL